MSSKTDADGQARHEDPRRRYVPPAIDQRAFSCVHCGAFSKQFWYSTHVHPVPMDSTPHLVRGVGLAKLKKQKVGDIATHDRPVLYPGKQICDESAGNLWIAHCYNCKEISIWIADRLLWPQGGDAPPPNPDLPEDVKRDYDEAASVLNLSPRGAAALLRLAIQKVCKELGQSGKNINQDIAALVQKGLDPRVRQALDVVRVIGNSAVHPGQIDLKDDRAVAKHLFGLVNLIWEIMFT